MLKKSEVGEVSREIQFMENQLEKLHALISSLENRLSSVLSQATPDRPSDVIRPAAASDLGKRISDANKTIQVFQERIVSLTERIQL